MSEYTIDPLTIGNAFAQANVGNDLASAGPAPSEAESGLLSDGGATSAGAAKGRRGRKAGKVLWTEDSARLSREAFGSLGKVAASVISQYAASTLYDKALRAGQSKAYAIEIHSLSEMGETNIEAIGKFSGDIAVQYQADSKHAPLIGLCSVLGFWGIQLSRINGALNELISNNKRALSAAPKQEGKL